MRETWKKRLGITLAALVTLLNFSAPVQLIKNIPDELRVLDGQSYAINFNLPGGIEVKGENVEVVGSTAGQTLAEVNDGHTPLELKSSGSSGQLELSLFGILPLKTIDVKVIESQSLLVGGQSIGVTLYTRGALVVGTAEITDENGDLHNPAQEAGLLPGDVIISAEGMTIEDSEHLSQIISNSKSESIPLTVERNGETLEISITPVKDMLDDTMRLGIWVRDSTAGVGTLSFCDPTTMKFGALGHAITDLDTGTTLTVKDGEIMHSRILDVTKGERGQPGELKGTFLDNQEVMGSISKNTQFGLYGTCYDLPENPIYPDPLPIGVQSMVTAGPATILTTLDDEGIKEYDCEIVEVNRQSKPTAKGMVVKITDKDLLERTGGIVQGMSGSPIIQNGRIVGAITHVFINDPTRGYGIFIEWMLSEANSE
ncbi:SpoIVB peptidase [Gehongia tenuis]|uniref:SpoIVB peptidase n=1 Tax=Gehongia tenuis TaxID=2763655 RepID=A0A926D4G8_9FIRM|nr:SpoIVB peptidase [Gehongia tenuis]MBC8531178.1 SpoIVB peptidase [Gehongia tenuis]